MLQNSTVDFFFAPVSAALALSAKAVTEPAQRLMVVAAAAGKPIYQNSSWTYQAVGSATQYVQTIVPTMRIKGAKTIAFICEPYRTFCDDVLFGQERYLNSQKISIAGTWATCQSLGPPVDSADLASNMTRIAEELKQIKPDVILGCLLSGDFQEALLRGLSSVDWLPKMLVVVPDYPLHFATVDDYTSNFMINLPVFSPEAAFPHSGANFNDSKSFAALFRATYGYEAETFAALGAQQGLLLQNALERAGSLSQTAVRDALRLTDLETFLGRTTFNVDGSNNLQLLMFQKVNQSGIIVSPPLWATGEVIYPMPLWSERTFSGKIGEPIEIAVIILTAVGICI
jgi:ABC-type branched-subunit amino acid transport system substrate-binding protein